MEHIKVENLSFQYPNRNRIVLDNINFTLEQGEFVVMCGQSGSGKTTLLRCFKPVLTPYGKKEGNIYLKGKEISQLSLREQTEKIGFVMQNPDEQIVTDKVWHELAFGLENIGMPQKNIRIRVGEMANYFGIANWFHKDVNKLSGGEKQLLNLASVMVMQPDLLILDEPTSQLDPIAGEEFISTLKKINEELGTTVIITEHRLENVFSYADRIIVLESGKIICNGKKRETGEILYNKKSPMFSAIPAPIRIYQTLEQDKKNNRVLEEGSLSKVTKEGLCPVTVGEGRRWLEESFENKDIHYKKIGCVNEITKTDNSIVNKPIIRLKDVWFRYETSSDDILKGADISIEKGKIHAILGSNGVGKSTLLKLICGINKPYSGKILVNGKLLKKKDVSISMLPQEPLNLFIYDTVEKDLQEMVYEADKAKGDKRIKEICDIMEIKDFLDCNPFDLSGGEQQRCGLAKVLLTNPDILLLDEPTKGIDNMFKTSLGRVLKLLKNEGITIIIVSHDVEFCAQFADTASLFFDGTILQTASTRDFFSKNNFYTTAASRMSRNIFEDTITAEEVIKLWKLNKE